MEAGRALAGSAFKWSRYTRESRQSTRWICIQVVTVHTWKPAEHSLDLHSSGHGTHVKAGRALAGSAFKWSRYTRGSRQSTRWICIQVVTVHTWKPAEHSLDLHSSGHGTHVEAGRALAGSAFKWSRYTRESRQSTRWICIQVVTVHTHSLLTSLGLPVCSQLPPISATSGSGPGETRQVLSSLLPGT